MVKVASAKSPSTLQCRQLAVPLGSLQISSFDSLLIFSPCMLYHLCPRDISPILSLQQGSYNSHQSSFWVDGIPFGQVPSLPFLASLQTCSSSHTAHIFPMAMTRLAAIWSIHCPVPQIHLSVHHEERPEEWNLQL